MDPIEANNEIIAETKSTLAKRINERFQGVSIHDFRMVQGPTHTNLIFDAVVPYGFQLSNEEVKSGIEGIVSESWDNYFAVIQVEQSYV